MSSLSKLASIVACLMIVAVSGCAGLKSTATGPKANRDATGLRYHLPMKDLSVNFTVADGKINTLTIATTSSYPDVSQAFLVDLSESYFQKRNNTLIAQNGVLTSATSTLEAVSLTSLAGAAAVNGFSFSLAPANQQRSGCMNGSYSYVIEFGKQAKSLPCHIEISGVENPVAGFAADKDCTPAGAGNAALYYRMNLPYKVIAKYNDISYETIVFSPSQSCTYSYKFPRSFFAKDTHTLTFDNGVLTNVTFDDESEIVGLLGAPATVLSQYTTALGKIFETRITAEASEAALLNQSVQLELAKIKYEACLNAVAANDTAAIAQLSCKN